MNNIIPAVIITIGLMSLAIGVNEGLEGAAVRFACVTQHVSVIDCSNWSTAYTNLVN